MTIDEFKNVDLRVAGIISAERIEGSDKLLKLYVHAGDTDEAGQGIPRQIIAGVGRAYEPESLIGKRIVIVANLEPRRILGLESRGMILAAHSETGDPVIVTVAETAPPGSKIS